MRHLVHLLIQESPVLLNILIITEGMKDFDVPLLVASIMEKELVIMTNSDSNNNSILEEIANSVATVYKWKDYYLPEIKKVVDVESSILE